MYDTARVFLHLGLMKLEIGFNNLFIIIIIIIYFFFTFYKISKDALTQIKRKNFVVNERFYGVKVHRAMDKLCLCIAQAIAIADSSVILVNLG